MAVTATANPGKAQFIVETGIGDNGKPILKTRTYDNIMPTATDEQVYAFCDKLGKLQSYPVRTIRRVGTDDIISA